MFWQENIKEEEFSIPETIKNISFQISSAILPIDHSYALQKALCKIIDCSPQHLAISDISVANGNGWEQDKNGFFYPSSRTKLNIRTLSENIDNIKQIIGQELNLGEYKITITKFKAEKKLSISNILFCKKIVHKDNQSEDDFLQECFNELQTMDIKVKKMMAGLSGSIKIDNKIFPTKSLMIADLSKADSVKLQENGLGKYQLFGCGIFNPQKGIDSVDAV